MTYGNSAASGLKQVEACGAKAGIVFNYTNEILMVDNFLPLFAMEAQQSKEQSKNIKANIQQRVADINNRVEKLTRKGLISDVFSPPIHQVAAGILCESADRLFSVQDTCNRCRVCEQVCPRGNIQVGNKPQFLHKCEVCYACIHHCPQNAIHLKFERSNARFINRNICLAEIVAANQQK
jgi:ferredoxin